MKGLCGVNKKKMKEKQEKAKYQREEKILFYEDYLGKLDNMKDIKFDFILNDDAEVLIRIRPKKYMCESDHNRNSDDLISIPSES